jgi:glycosyltransferase involved in cell wall biosynthesis
VETVDKIAVLIPCYNEGATIGKVVGDFAAALPGAVIYVYDNNSSDGTAEIAARAGAVVRREYKQGKGNVIRRMFREIDAQCYVMTDGDDTYPAEDAPKMAEQVLGRGVDMVIGDRLSSTYFTENKRPFHNTGNRLVRALINFLFKNDVRDIMTGYRAFSYGFVKTFPVLSHGFEIETEMTIHCLDKNLSLSSVVVDYRDRPEGSVSKLNTYRDGARVLRTVFSLYKDYRPFQFFSILALLLLLIGMIFLLPVVVEYARTGLVPRFPSFFASGFFALGALQSFFGGMILDTIVKDRRQEFEIRLNEFQHFYSGLLENPGK